MVIEYLCNILCTCLEIIVHLPNILTHIGNTHFYTKEFRHWWKSSRLLVRLAGLYVYSYDPVKAPAILILDPQKRKTIKKLTKFAKQLGQVS